MTMQSGEAILMPSDLVAKDERRGLPCGICRRQFARYHCPSCNLSYCSLLCFRSELHTQCSESFYRKELESDIKVAPSSTAQERVRTMELLKRFEEESSDLPTDSDDGEEGEDMNNLAQRLASFDLESASADQVWEVLTPEERRKFLKAVQDPSSELAQRLLASEELEKERREPWWEAPHLSDSSPPSNAKRYGAEPAMIDIPSSMIKPTLQGPFLIYNVCAILIAYAYATRRLSRSPLGMLPPEDPDRAEARRLISLNVPFLTDRTTKTVHPSLSSAVTDVWSRCPMLDAHLCSILILDVARLIQPALVTVFSASSTGDGRGILDSHAHRICLLVFSDLVRLYEPNYTQLTSSTGSPQNHTTRKLTFYAAHVLSTLSAVLDEVARECSDKSERIRGEVESTDLRRTRAAVFDSE